MNGFEINDGGLTVVPGSHLFRDNKIHAESDADLEANWLRSKQHPTTGQPLVIEHLSVPTGTVILMWTHAAHGVTARQADSDTRWTVVYAYRNPGKPSGARWISQAYEDQKRSDPDSELKDRFATSVSFMQDYLNQTLYLNLTGMMIGKRGEDGGVNRASLEYDVVDDFSITGGLMLFQSGENVYFQSLNDNDRIFFEARYSF